MEFPKSFVGTPLENKYNYARLEPAIVSAKKMPVGKNEVYNFDKIEIQPLAFYDIVYHSRNFNKNWHDYQKLMYHFNVGKIKISNFGDLFLPDAYYALFLMYVYSLSDSFKISIDYVCEHCETYNDFNVNIYEIAVNEYSGYEFYVELPADDENESNKERHGFRYLKADEVLKKLPNLYATSKRDYDLDIALLILSHNNYEINPHVIEEYIANLTYKKAFIIMSALYLFNEPVQHVVHKCTSCNAENKVNVMLRVFDDFFDLFLKNCSV